MSRRVQLMVSDEEYELYVSYFYDGIRGRVIRNLLKRACDAIEDPDSNVTVDGIVRGNFELRGKDYGNF